MDLSGAGLLALQVTGTFDGATMLILFELALLLLMVDVFVLDRDTLFCRARHEQAVAFLVFAGHEHGRYDFVFTVINLV